MKLKISKLPRGTIGFTLIELILGMLITAIIGLCIYNMFWQSLKLDDKMRHVHENFTEVLMADYALTHDLENAIKLDFSSSYQDAVIFDGQKNELSFLTQTPQGIKRVRYYSGLLDQGGIEKSMIGRVINPSNPSANQTDALPIEFLIRQESSLADWLNETSDHINSQIVAIGLKKGSFNCQYAPAGKDLHMGGSKELVYSDTWDEKSALPLEVSCHFVLYDPKKPDAGLSFNREILLAPVEGYHNEQ